MVKFSLQIGSLAFATVGALLVGGCGSSSSDNPTPATTGSASTGGPSTGGAPASGQSNLSGSVKIDGSSTVFPIVDADGEDFGKANPGVKPVVNKSGTGSGFQKFIRGDIDIATASRPITSSEEDALKKANIEYMEVPIAYDGVCIVVNPANSAVASLTPADLKKAWADGSTVKTWADWHAGWSATKINFYGPTDNHGTYEFFTEVIDGKKGNIRKDYQPNQDYNVIIQDVATDKDGIGYCGLNYYLENKDKVKAVPIDGGKGPILPSEQAVDDGTYSPLSRPLFIYVNKKSYARPEVKAFVEFVLGPTGANDIKEAKYVVLPKDVLDLVNKRVAAGTAGSIFDKAKPGTPTSQILLGAK
jgi:phosphate transport system substrate-binding protein